MDNRIISEDATRIVGKINLQEIENKDILIVGGTGLIGTSFIYSIIEAANRGIVPNKLCITHLHSLPFFLEFVRKHKWIYLLEGDLTDDSFVETIGSFDYIIHLAGYGQPAQFSIDPVKTIKLNTTLTMALLEKLRISGKFLFASSSGIYNGLEKESFTEDDVGTTNTIHPRACYYEGKKCGEVIVNSYRQSGIDAKSVRLSYTYGPGVRNTDERALYSFIKKSFSGHINLLDDGSAERIYCYISDAIELMWNVFLYGDKPIYNIGGTEKTTIYRLARIIGDIMHADVIIPEDNNSIPGNHSIERLDMTRTLNQFPISYISLDEGLARTVAWYKSNYFEKK